MRAIREITLFSLLVLATSLAQKAGAGPFDALPYYGCSDIFGTENASIATDCKLYGGADSFIDTCQVPNQAFAAGLSFSSVQTSGRVNARASSIDSCTIQTRLEPFCRTLTGSPVQSPDFLFADVVGSDEQTVVLQFAGDRRAVSEHTVVWWQWMYSERFTYTGVGAGDARAAAHDWSLDF